MEVNFNMDPHDILRLSMTIFYEKKPKSIKRCRCINKHQR